MSNEERIYLQSNILLMTACLLGDEELFEFYARDYYGYRPQAFIGSWIFSRHCEPTENMQSVINELFEFHMNRIEHESPEIERQVRCFFESRFTLNISDSCLRGIPVADNLFGIFFNIEAVFYNAMHYLENQDLFSLNRAIEKLEEYAKPSFEIAAPWGSGRAAYFLGTLHAKMGETTLALEYFKRSRELGFVVERRVYKYDPVLTALLGNPEFEALTDPIWPEILN